MIQYRAILIGNGTMGKRHRSRFEGCGVLFDKVLDAGADKWLFENAGNLNVDFAVVASPASTHYDYVKFFLKKNIPVLVEKPLSVTAAEAMELVKISEDRDTLLFVAQSECYNPLFLNFRKHLLLDLRNAVEASRAVSGGAAALPLNVALEFRREHGYCERCRDVDVSLDLLVHDVSLFLNMFDGRDVAVLDGDGCDDRRRLSLKVVSGEFAGVRADFIADRNSDADIRRISVAFGRHGNRAGFEYSVSLARYTEGGAVAHIPDSLDNEHKFFLKLMSGSFRKWARRALLNAAQTIAFLGR
ncbi:MAG: Gfo/Idh/MocA family oxidoreductase [Fibrobacter sp.]|nr:Gfo/Idh/MocA family oxidoreductase [Fibrobacter sp.]